MPILLVEQNLRVVRRLATDVIVLAGGRVVHTGKAADLLDDDALIRRFLGVHSGEDEPAAKAHLT
jgi:branched-chain amino acid transport system ATP-binding protein